MTHSRHCANEHYESAKKKELSSYTHNKFNITSSTLLHYTYSFIM